MKQKQYFTKYLPVEEEIKEGDWILDSNNYVYKCTRIDNTYLNCSGYNGIVRIFKCKKAKLFLCSKDIQIGDKVTFPETLKERIVDETIKSLDTYKLQEYFKVIGEISEGATWVKEKDEFTEEEIMKFHHIWGNNDDFIYLIRCSQCKSFH